VGVGIPSSVKSGSSDLRGDLGASYSMVSVRGSFVARGAKEEEYYP
jgi:hypothetical protein